MKKKKKYFNKLLISYLLLIPIPLLVFGYLSYFYISNNIMEVDKDYNLKMLHSSANTVDVFLKEMDGVIINAVVNDEINRYTGYS